MRSYLPPHALAFRDLFAQVEHVLRRNGYSRTDRAKAEIDWQKFAQDLGDPFFGYVLESEAAGTLIGEPPRAYYLEGGWKPRNQEPIRNVVELFLRGVCQVRNNIEHGKKFIAEEGPRSDALVNEAHWVLEQAALRHAETKSIFAKLRRSQ
jgi:hypothetical protein